MVTISGANTDTTLQQVLYFNIKINSASEENAIRTATQYANITALASNSFITGQNYRIAISVDLSFLKITPNSVQFCLSPVVLTCVYGA
jgi:hypothetical protein